jgi:hypothetical protein
LLDKSATILNLIEDLIVVKKSNNMRLMFRKWLIFGGIAAALIAAIIASVTIFDRPEEIPQEFLEARASGAEIAKSINSFADSVVADLQSISRKNEDGDYTAALDLTIEEIKKAREAKDRSLDLLGELQKMVPSIEKMRTDEAQQLAMQAVSTEVALVGKLIEYNDDLNKLLNNMRLKFVSYDPAIYNEQTDAITKTMNEKALQINEMSRKYQALMSEFDETVGNK